MFLSVTHQKEVKPSGRGFAAGLCYYGYGQYPCNCVHDSLDSMDAKLESIQRKVLDPLNNTHNYELKDSWKKQLRTEKPD